MNTQAAYHYTRDRDGTFDTIDIRDPAGAVIASMCFWDEPDTGEAGRAEADARTVVDILNRWALEPEWPDDL